MKIVVISDSHGGAGRVSRAINSEPGAEVVIHLGDGLRDIAPLVSQYPEKAFLLISGNNDWYGFGTLERRSEEALVDLGGKKVMLIHGHKYGVRYGTHTAAKYAISKGADILLFGHTHQQLEQYMSAEETGTKPLYIFNPGSLSAPDSGYNPSYGRLEIGDFGVVFTVVEM